MSDSMQVFDRAAVRRHRDRRGDRWTALPTSLRTRRTLLDRLDDTTRRFLYCALDLVGGGVTAPLLRARGIATIACDLSARNGGAGGGATVAADEEFCVRTEQF